ncbi:hypothetical protein, partial [Vibrio parahaemolyticus]
QIQNLRKYQRKWQKKDSSFLKKHFIQHIKATFYKPIDSDGIEKTIPTSNSRLQYYSLDLLSMRDTSYSRK